MIFVLTFSLLVTFSLSGGVIYLLYLDRNQWHDKYVQLADDTRKREAFFIDRILEAKQIRTVASADKVIPPPKHYVSPDEVSAVKDMLEELVEVGGMSPAEAQIAISDFRSGKMTQAELDQRVWLSGPANLQGSTQF